MLEQKPFLKKHQKERGSKQRKKGKESGKVGVRPKKSSAEYKKKTTYWGGTIDRWYPLT